MENIFYDIGIIIIAGTLAGFLMHIIKQPIMLGYILAGIILGPVTGIVTDIHTITILSEIGIAFLLFIVGIDLDLKKLKHVGGVASIGGLVQMLILFLIGLAVALAFGYSTLTSIYVGLIIMFSSTMIVLKLLSDNKQIDTLHSRIIIGTLLMQDVIAIISLSILSQLEHFNMISTFITLLTGITLIIAIYFLAKFIFPYIFKKAAHSQELLFLLGLTVCFAFSFMFEKAGFSMAIGAFIAGVAIGNLPYNIEIGGRVKPLKDFFSVLFFTTLGLELVVGNYSNIIYPLIALLVVVIIGKPIIITIIVALFGYKKRVAFITGVNLAQISEFALILAAQGLLLNHISREIYTIAILVAVISIVSTSYFVKYEQKLYQIFAKNLKFLDKFGQQNALELFRDDKKHNVILCGYNRVGYSIMNSLQKGKKDFLVVDYNPDIIKKLINRKIPCIYGDLSDPDIIDHLHFDEVELIISTVPDFIVNEMIISQVMNKKRQHAKLILTAYSITEALELYKKGADYVIVPHLLGGEHVSVMLEEIGDNIEELIKTKLRHINELHLRKNMM